MQAEDPKSPKQQRGKDVRGHPGAGGTQRADPVQGQEGLPEKETLQSPMKAASPACTWPRGLPAERRGAHRVGPVPALCKALSI